MKKYIEFINENYSIDFRELKSKNFKNDINYYLIASTLKIIGKSIKFKKIETSKSESWLSTEEKYTFSIDVYPVDEVIDVSVDLKYNLIKFKKDNNISDEDLTYDLSVSDDYISIVLKWNLEDWKK